MVLPESSNLHLSFSSANIQYGIFWTSLLRTSRVRLSSSELAEFKDGKNCVDRKMSKDDILLFEMLR